MYMVFVCPNLKELHLVPGLNGKGHLLENLINMLVKHSSAILRRKYEVVQKYREIVTLMDVIAHPYNLRRKRRGIQP